jgi:hypothetical protein
LRGKRNNDMVWRKYESMELASESRIDSDGFRILAALKLGYIGYMGISHNG